MTEAVEEKISRKQQILQTLAIELEKSPGQHVTTAGLAKAVGVSEAALYRHFASKAKMFEALIEFIEETVFSLINRILEQEKTAASRCEKILTMVLGFTEKNPGITRILSGDVLTGEIERLRIRVGKFYERLETQLKQVLREAEANGEIKALSPVAAQANLFLAVIEGRIQQFVRSKFAQSPLANWDKQWPMLAACLQ